MPGLTVPPVSATRTGCASLPMARPCSLKVSVKACSIAASVNAPSAASLSIKLRRRLGGQEFFYRLLVRRDFIGQIIVRGVDQLDQRFGALLQGGDHLL